MIKKRKLTLMQRSTMDSFSADVNVYMQRHKSGSFARNFVSWNYRLFSHVDVSYRFNGKNDNFVLKLYIKNAKKYDLLPISPPSTVLNTQLRFSSNLTIICKFTYLRLYKTLPDQQKPFKFPYMR